MKHGGIIYQFARLIGCLPEQALDFATSLGNSQK
jgi:hypothetical protein